MGGDGRRVLPLPSVLHALLEPALTQPDRGDPGCHVLVGKLLHELVVNLAVARKRHQPLLGLSLVFEGQSPPRRRWLPRKCFAQQLGQLASFAQLELPPLLAYERFPGGLAGSVIFFSQSSTLFSRSFSPAFLGPLPR